MAKRMCELCQQKLAYDMRFGVHLCEDCVNGYNKSFSNDTAAINYFSNPKNFPYATEEAQNKIVHTIAKLKPQNSDAPNETYSAPINNNIKPAAKKGVPPVTYNHPDNSVGLLDELYENIGKKIKKWAKWIFILEAIAAIISGLGLLFAGEDTWLFGLLDIILGPSVALVSTWLLYGFGELIEKTAANEQSTRQILKIMSDNNKKE